MDFIVGSCPEEDRQRNMFALQCNTIYWIASVRGRYVDGGTYQHYIVKKGYSHKFLTITLELAGILLSGSSRNTINCAYSMLLLFGFIL